MRDFLFGETPGTQVGEQSVPGLRRVAEFPGFRDFQTESTRFQVIPRAGGFGGFQEVVVEPQGGLSMERKQAAAQVVLARFLGRRRLLDDWNPRTLGKSPDRRGEIHMLVVHHKAEHAATRAASEAMV